MNTFSPSSTILPFPSLSKNSIFFVPFKGKTNQFSFSKSRIIACSSPQDASSNEITPNNFCIIEGPETVQDFVQMQVQEIQDNIKSRRNKIFLLMEEVRRLRVQQRLRSIQRAFSEEGEEDANEMPEIPSSIPFLPHVTPNTLRKLYLTGASFISAIIVFGGLIAPTLELKLGIGGTSYEDFIRSLHLPLQLSQVDPIVASFSGGAVGVISVLMLIEL
uniref:Transmembrane protein n=1 Tax=Medicago truncatula TaxID=3880 RepID=I3T0D2_MEDTR|nr:unknown [Medicago truncatula]